MAESTFMMLERYEDVSKFCLSIQIQVIVDKSIALHYA